MNSIEKHTAFIKQKATELGFLFCGISKAEFLEEDAPRLEQWLTKNYHGSMGYMENHFDKRLDPRLLVDGARSVVSLIYNYFPSESLPSDFKVSKYAYGEDYHIVIKDKLKLFLKEIHETIGEVNGRAFVDSAPVMDKVWAKRSGIGWIGKNANLITKGVGSFFFIAELILDLELIPDGPVKDFCGTCTKCIDACPTDAIVAPYVVDGSKCISYFTIELKDQLIPNSLRGSFDDWVFGCDICQDVCPWNRFSKPSLEQRFAPSTLMIEHASTNWKDITEEAFAEVFRKSPINRAKYSGFVRNISFLKGKS